MPNMFSDNMDHFAHFFETLEVRFAGAVTTSKGVATEGGASTLTVAGTRHLVSDEQVGESGGRLHHGDCFFNIKQSLLVTRIPVQGDRVARFPGTPQEKVFLVLHPQEDTAQARIRLFARSL